MADNFNDPFATNLVGLWDFLSGNPKGDTGLADGIAQNGTLEGGAGISGGRLHLDNYYGGHEYFDVDGDDGGPKESAFDLSEGTISVQFTQDKHIGSSHDTLVNRGEYDDRSHEGWFAIQVTHSGEVKVLHHANGKSVLLRTSEHFFDQGDNVKATYAWSETEGLTFTVENLTTGATETITNGTTGLTMDIGDNDDEIFTFGARESDDGSYDQFFDGSIDYVAVYDRDILNAVDPDGAVDGEEFGEVMELGYDDSNAPTNQGGDMITNGDDLIFGNGGDDTIDGAAGDDTIYGDTGSDLGVVGRESFNWEGASESEIDHGFAQNTGSVTVTYDRIKDTGNHESFLDHDDLNVSGIDTGGETIDDDSGLRSETNGHGNQGDFEWVFSDPVGNVEFNVNDIDGDGVVRIKAYDSEGRQIDVELVGGSNLTVTGNVADSNGGYQDTDSNAYNLQVTIPGPVSRIVVEHDQNGGNNSGITVTDIYFDVLDPAAAEGGDDVITGGAGSDDMYGEGGDDTFIVGSASDGDGDVIVGGSGPDDTADNDVLDLRGAGPVTIVDADDATDDGARAGTVTFEDGSTLTFSQIETILTDPVEEAPVANDDTAVVDEDDTVVIDVLDNDTDANGDDLTVTEATSPDGEVTINPDGTLTFAPNENFNGDTTISYTVTDGNGGFDTATVDVTVNPVNDAPDAVNDAETTPEDTPVTVDVLGNDTDVDGDMLTITGASVPADQGTVAIVDNKLLFTPAENFNGDATISYSITDGNGGTDTADAVVTVTPVNDDPVAVDDLEETDEDTAVVIDLVGNDTDVDGDPLTIGTVSVPADQGSVVDNGDGTVTFTPAPNFNGTATIDYTVVDGQGGEDDGQAIVNVGAVNDGPTAVDDIATTDEDTPVTIDVLDNDTDVDGDDLTITGASVPADQGIVEIVDNELLFTPAENYNGPATITYTVSDGHGGTDTGTVDVTVNPVNDDPVAVDDIETTDEDVPVVVDLLGNDTDVDGDDLTLGTVTVPADQGSVVDNGDGTVTFTPAPNFNGPATITYTVLDGQGGEDEGQAIVSVGAVNDGPVAGDDADTTPEDTPVTVSVLDNDTDADGDDLSVTSAVVPAAQGSVVINPDNTLTFTPAENFNGEATITYTITDGNGGSDTADLVIDVTPVNDDPVANDDAETTPFDTPVIIDVLDNDTDVDGDTLRVTEATSPDGDVTINADGTLTFTPTAGFEGDAVIDYTITDDNGGFDSAQVVVTVEEQPLDGIVSGTDDGELIDIDYLGDPEGDRVDNNDEILPGEGPNDDIIQAGGGDDTIIAGEGNDDVFAGEGDDRVHGGPGDDILRGEEGEDEINGGAGDDTIDGGDDNDVINGGDGSDSILGGDGDDLITSSDPDNDLKIDKGYPGLFTGEEGTPEAENERDFVDGGAGNDTISTGDDRDTIIGGTGNDVIDGGIDDDEITGDDGADRIVGGEGSDTIEGGTGDDTIYAGNDPVLGLDALNIEDDGSNPFGPDLRPDNGRDFVDGGEGNDLIFGADDDDTLIGGSGNDTIDGEIDDDLIDGGIGDDSLLGGQGNDTILGGDGNDFINAGRNADSVDGGDGNDTIFGENGADVLNGGAGDDVIDGGTGDDTLNGDDGDDLIMGATGDDVIDGGAGNDTIDGGNGGSDIMRGGDDRDLFINVDAGEVVDGDEGGDDFDTLDLRGSAPGGGSLNIVYDPTNPENGVVNYFDTNGDPAGSLTFSNIENVIPCFTPGTHIATPKGERRIEELMVGDRVITRDNGIQEIRWIGQRTMTGEELAIAEHLRPVLIRQGALGKGLPERDMLVSPQHRVLMSSDKTALYFDESEVLVAAKHLTDMDGIDVVEVSETTYIHVMFDQHEVILSDGAWTESFQPGDQTLSSMGDAQRAEILELFPELRTVVGIEAYAAARRSLKKHEAKLLTQ